MPEVERVSGKHRPRRGRGRDETALAWVKWGSVLVIASLASFFVSLYWIAPRVYPSRSPADTSPQVSRDEADLTENRVALPTIEDRERVGSREHKPRPATESVREARPETRAEESRHVAETPLTGGTTGTEAPQSVTVRPAPEPAPSVDLPSQPAAPARDWPKATISPARDAVPSDEPASPTAKAEGAEPSPGARTEDAASNGEGALFRVEVGAPATRADAERLASELRQHGFASHVVVEGNIIHVQAGAFRSRRNAERLATRLGDKGYAATIAGGPDE